MGIYDEQGGPAYPQAITETDDEGQKKVTDYYFGASLRDWFAAKELGKVVGPLILDEPVMYERLAEHCYRMADAMLRARGE